jgi:hypothetical protein
VAHLASAGSTRSAPTINFAVCVQFLRCAQQNSVKIRWTGIRAAFSGRRPENAGYVGVEHRAG